MKSLRFQPEENPSIVVTDQPDRRPGAEEVTVRVLAASAGPFDFGPASTTPSVVTRTPGVGAIGSVEEIGADVIGMQVGDMVVVDTVLRCLCCNACHASDADECTDPILAGISAGVPGAMAESICVPQSNVYLVGAANGPQGVLLPYAAWCFRALRVSQFLAGDTVVVVGAGLLGAMTALVAEALGASSITIVDDRTGSLELALSGARRSVYTSGVVPAFNADDAPWTPDGPEVVVCTTGDRAALRTSLSVAGARTTVVLLDLAADSAIEVEDYIPELLSKEVRFEAFASTSRDDFRRVTKLWLTGILDLSRLPLESVSLEDLPLLAGQMSSGALLPYRYLDLGSMVFDNSKVVA